jgi:hypothetical protein
MDESSQSRTAIKENALGELAHHGPILLEHMLAFTHQSPFCVAVVKKERTRLMSSMISQWEVCTLICKTYLAALLSMLPMTEVNEGHPLEPGGGCVMSAPGEQISGEYSCTP